MLMQMYKSGLWRIVSMEHVQQTEISVINGLWIMNLKNLKSSGGGIRTICLTGSRM